MELQEIKQKINKCLESIYVEHPSLFVSIQNKIRCERCLVFRLAYYLQNQFQNYFVDCDYNSSMKNGQRFNGKPVQNSDGTTTNRLIDIIVHKRTDDDHADFICFEIKRWDNYNGRGKDRNNLIRLTSNYRYEYGFHIILGKTIEKIRISIFKNGEEIPTE